MPKEIKILAIIPARGGSKGIPKKNIVPLGKKPLIHYSIREAKRARSIDAIIVSTDNEEIASIARTLGAEVPFLRPTELATDTSRDIDFLKHAVEWLETNRGWNPEIVVFLQPTSPTRTAADIDKAIEMMKSTNCDSVRTATEDIDYHPFKTLAVVDESSGKIVPTITMIPSLSHLGVDVPRQLLPKMVRPVGLVYATRTRFIKEGRVWGDDVRFISIPRDKITDIDKPDDLVQAEAIMNKLGLLE